MNRGSVHFFFRCSALTSPITLSFLAIIVWFFCKCDDVFAQPSFTWSSASAGNFFANGNWSGGNAPNGVGHQALINSNPTNAGDFTLNGSGTLGELRYANSLARSINGNGTLTMQVNSGNALIWLTQASGGLDLNFSNLQLNSTTEFRIASSASNTWETNIGGTGGILVTRGEASGTGSLTLTGTNTYSGTTTINSNMTLRIGAGSTTGTLGSGNVVNNGTLQISRSNSYTISNQISGSGSLFKDSAGTTILTGNNSYGATTVTGETLQIGNNSTTGTLGTGTVTLQTATQLTFSRSNAYDVANTITGAGTVRKSSTGTVSLTANNSYGATIIDSGTLQVGNNTNNGSLGTGAVSIASGAQLAFRRNTNYNVTNTISGAGSIVKHGTNIVTLSSASNSYSGGTTVNGGALVLGASNAFGSGTITVNGGELSIGSFSDSVGLVTLVNGIISGGTGTLSSTSGFAVQSGTISARLGGTGGLTKTTAGIVTLSGANTYIGLTTVSAGTLALGANNVLASAITVSGGTFSIGSNSDTVGLVTLTSGSITGTSGVLIGTGYDVRSGDISAILGGSSSLTKSTTGIVTITSNSTYSGLTTITGGTLRLGNNTSNGSVGAGNILNNANLEISRSNNINFDNTIGGTGNLIKSGSGTTTLTANNTYSGNTTVSSGILVVGSTAQINSSANANSQIAVNGGGLQINNGGQITLGSNGVTNVNSNSVLTVNGTLTSPTVNVNGTSQLLGTGTVTGNVNVGSTAVLAPGNSIGSLSITGNLDLNGQYRWEVQSGTSNADVVIVSGAGLGNIDLANSTIQIVQLGTFTQGQKFTLFAYTGTLSGVFANGGSLAGWNIVYNDTTPGLNGPSGSFSYVTIEAIPEPSALILVGCSLWICFPSRRRYF